MQPLLQGSNDPAQFACWYFEADSVDDFIWKEKELGMRARPNSDEDL